MAEAEGNEDLLHQESVNARMSPVTVTSEHSNDFMSISSGMPGNVMDDDLEMAASLMAMDGEPTVAAGVIEPVDQDMPVVTPPLPVVDYHRKLGSPVSQWAPLPPGLEVEGEKDIVWPISNWSLASQRPSLLSVPVELCGFNWQVLLMPMGTDEVRNRAVSVYIKAVPLTPSDDWHVCARIIISIRNANDDSIGISKNSQHRFEPTEPDWGFNQFTTPKCLVQGDNSTGHKALLSDDKLVVVGRVQIIKDPTGMLWHTFINYDSKKATGFVGLLNQGATCYMNSLLQSLYMTNLLRKATYKIPTDNDKPSESIALALQRTFYRLQTNKSPVGTTELTKSFGWDSVESFMQHDVHEFNRVLLDELESKMKKTEVEGMVQKLFTGRVKNVRKCLNVDFESSRQEDFYDVQLTIRGMRNLKESFEAYIKPEFLTEDNKYFTEEHGYQDAKMFCIFERFPPVLHLHLERYTFDPMTGNTIKINDRLEFPTKINLDAYLSETADKSVSQDYTLHSVLVHGGDSHGGHYCVFIKHGDKWFKFDDTKVVQVTEREAVEDNFGVSPDDNGMLGTADGEIVRLPSWNKVQRFKRITNAYMLVYIRDADFDQVMAPATDADVPSYISQGIRLDEEADERKRAEKYEILNALHVSLFTDEMLRSYAGPDFFNLTNRALPFSQYESIRSKKSETVAEFKAYVAQETGLPLEHLRLWTFSSRRNHTCRLDSPVLDDEKTLGQLISGTRMQSQLNLYLEVKSTGFEEVTSDSVMVMVKYFDREQQSLRVLGNVLLVKSDQIKAVIEKVAGQLGPHTDEETWEFFEEIKTHRIDPLLPSNSFEGSRLATGDIILIQRRCDDSVRLPSVLDYFHELSQQVVVCFKPFIDETASRKRSSEDVSQVQEIEPNKEIQNVYSFDVSFAEILFGVAKHFGDVDPSFIRLHIEDPKTGRFYPMKSLERPDLTLYQAIVTASPITMTQRENVTELAFAVEVLPCTLEELESMKPLNVHLSGIKGVNETESVEVYISFDASLRDLISRLPSPFKELVDPAKEYRLVEVQGHKVHRDYALDDLLSTVPECGNVYLFPIDLEQETSDCKLINVTRYWRDITRPHSLPFIFPLHPAEQWTQTRKRLLTCAGVTIEDAPVSAVSFGLARPIADDEILYDRVAPVPGSNRIPNSDSLAIEIAEISTGTPNRPTAEKSIKIRSFTPAN